MSGPWEQDDGLDGDDFVEGIDDEEEELGMDYHTAELVEDDDDDEPAIPLGRPNGRHPAVGAPLKRQPHLERPQRRKRKFRIKRMSERMANRSRNVSSILITRTDGSQVLIVKGGR